MHLDLLVITALLSSLGHFSLTSRALYGYHSEPSNFYPLVAYYHLHAHFTPLFGHIHFPIVNYHYI